MGVYMKYIFADIDNRLIDKAKKNRNEFNLFKEYGVRKILRIPFNQQKYTKEELKLLEDKNSVGLDYDEVLGIFELIDISKTNLSKFEKIKPGTFLTFHKTSSVSYFCLACLTDNEINYITDLNKMQDDASNIRKEIYAKTKDLQEQLSSIERVIRKMKK